jgi:YidC/Oxa1 family membrane protein insertase
MNFLRRLLAASICFWSPLLGAATQVDTESLRLTFDDAGNLRSAIACFPSCKSEGARIQQFGDAGVVSLESGKPGAWMRGRSRPEGYYALIFEHASGAAVKWRIPTTGYRLELQAVGMRTLTMRSGESFRPREASGFGTWLEQARYAVFAGGELRQTGLGEDGAGALSDAQWAGYRNRYWALMARAPEQASVELVTGEQRLDAEVRFAAVDGAWYLYLGPVEPGILKSVDPQLSGLLYAGLWFWLRWICFALYYLLTGIASVLPSWGLSIMVLSVAVNILMLPLSRIADRFQQQVNETEARLAPGLQRLKKQYKGEEQAAKILALYKTERVHPLYSLKSLMGVAVVIPVFIGAFDMLAENIHLLNTAFLWIADLSRPDALARLGFRLPFFGAELNLLPFLMTGLSVLASALHKPLALNAELRRRQVRNMLLLALAFFVLFYTFPAGMVLYWTTNNLISVIKSLWARR